MRPRRRGVLMFFCWSLLFAGAAGAQEAAPEGHSHAGWVPEEILKRPAPLREGVGKLHDVVTTGSKEAQAYYDQGMAYLISYVWIEAARSFHQALRLDPNLAMAYIGLSDAYLGLQDSAAARAAYEKAAGLAASASERERRRIAIRGAQLAFLDDSRNAQKYFAYRKTVEDALTADPGDSTLWILLGFVQEGMPLAHGQGGGALSIAIYEAALARAPDTAAAHHYLAHTYENLGRYDEALPHAEAYARSSPAIPHAHHMLGHILRRAGRTGEAIQEFLKADEIQKAYARVENIPIEWDWHHAHNLSLWGVSYQYLGQMKAAAPLLREAYELPTYTDFAELNRKEWPEFLLSTGRLEEALEAARAMARGKWAPGRAVGHTLGGRALLALGRTAEAREELTAAEQEMRPMANPTAVLPYFEGYRGELFLREKQWREGASLLKQAAVSMRRVSGPDAWTQTMFWLEWIGRTAREAGDWELAGFIAQQMLEQDPSYGGTHVALGLVAEHKGETAEAASEFAQAAKLWSNADAAFPSMVFLRKKLSTMR